jgi:hypothetical protein
MQALTEGGAADVSHLNDTSADSNQLTSGDNAPATDDEQLPSVSLG